ncbi:MAG: endo-beta-N-acetylglucosaminidase [Clostridium sp.]|uniref:endo-beta-N-acetylglucosaminidase n=1 Tax=Clostridium sp. TaxID=1506 RepID=UPI003F3BA9E2
MRSKKIKILITVGLACSLSLGLISCSSGSTAGRDTKATYQITEEAGDSSELIMMNQPTAPHWFPNQLLEWDGKSAENVEYNKSVVPLAKRVDKEKLTPVNETQNKDMNVVAISMMNGSTSGNPSQGSNKFGANTFSYWQYIDKLVYWGGSAGEGIIVPPSADVTDSAHKNGVPVLGTVFFPTTEHGGKAEWVNQFLVKDKDGNFPMVDKLIESAKTLGFDGWFINQETGLTKGENDFIDQKDTAKEGAKITKKHSELMQEFIKQFKAKAKDDLEIMWYDSITENGEMDWQNALTEKNDYFLIDGDKESVADSMFLNFWWTNKKYADKELLQASNDKAKELGLNPFDLYAGIDVQANGVNTPVRWDLFEGKDNAPLTSLGLYCPSWTYFSSSNVDEFQSKENRLWVNELGDPSKATETKDKEWKGISTYAVEKTVVNSLPFTTNFNIGNGYNFFIDGEKVSSLDWNNRSLADIMPTYRWIIDNAGSNTLKASLDFSNAFYGGNSIKLAGNLGANESSTIKLYSADLKIEKGTKFTTTAKSDKEVNLDLVLEFHDGSSETITGDKAVGSEWTTVSYDVSKLKDKSIKTISYKLTSKEAVSNLNLNLGNISVSADKEAKKVDASNLKVDDTSFEEDNMFAGVKLSWDEADKENLSHYEVYKVNGDKSKTFLGATPNNKYFLNALKRDDKSDSTEFEVVAVNKDFKIGKSATTKMDWPDNSIPKANFKVSKTLVTPGEEIKFENLSSQVTETVEWNFPGAKVETSTEKTPTVSYDKEGVYNVTLKAKNDKGEDVKVMEELITVSKKASKDLTNLSKGKKAEASSFVNPNEAPEFALDGKTDTKWCAVGTPPHNITIDLGSVMTVSEVRMAHAEAGGESPDMNTSDYTIEVSEDGKNFTEVVAIKKNSLKETINSFKATKARYVKVNVSKPAQGSDSAVRIYGIDVLGMNDTI